MRTTAWIRRLTTTFGLASASALVLAAPAAAAGEPAGGAPTRDLIPATIVAALATGLLLWTASAHRAGRISWLGNLGGFTERVSGLPAWSALPSAVAGVSLLMAVFGFYWDVGTHIDDGRDAGPFANVAHYPILFGLAGIALAGFLSIVLGTDSERTASIRIAEGWRAPLGGVLLFLCGAFALSGFPLDDVWHRIFGQDVTLWGPTHILMVGGAALSTLALWALLVQGLREARPAESRLAEGLVRFRELSAGGAFLLGLTALHAEFDFGVPQFRLLYQPVLIMLAAGMGLVAARVRLGRGGALAAVGFYLVIRGLLTLVVGPVLGHSTLHFAPYVAEAIIVELVALRVPRERPLQLGAAAGALIGTVGLAAEWGWSHVWMPLPWPSSLLPEAAILGFAAALAGGVLGGAIGRSLLSPRQVPRVGPRWVVPAAGLVAVACIAYPLPMSSGDGVSATVALNDVRGGPERAATADVRLDPRTAADEADWLTITAWQGGDRLVIDRLDRVGQGHYRSTEPVPLHGDWKAMLRLQSGNAVSALPIYLPEDRAIPVEGVAAPQRFTRSFVRDSEILRREETGGSPALTVLAYGVLLSIVVVWFAAMAWGLGRLRPDRPEPPEPRGPRVGGLRPA